MRRDIRLTYDYLDELRRRHLSSATIYRRRLCSRSLIDWLHARDLRLSAATTDDVQAFLDGRGLGGRSRYAWLSNLHCFYGWAVDAGRLRSDPTARIVRPRLPRGLPRPIDPDDLAAAVELADPVMAAWLTLMAFAGLRCGEVAGLRAEDVVATERGPMVHVAHGKGDKARYVPAHPAVLAALRRVDPPPRGWLWRRPRGGAATGNWVSFRTNRYLRDLGISDTAHSVRHLFATRTLRVARDVRVVQELLGHEDIASTQVYTAIDMEDAFAAVLALEPL